MAEAPIWSPFEIALSMKADAAAPKRLSEKRYQMAAWVSAIATSIRSRSVESYQTSPPGSHRSPQPMALDRIWREGRAESESVLWETSFPGRQRESYQSPPAEDHAWKALSPVPRQ